MQTDPSLSSGRIRFGDFEVDVRSHELRRFGRKVRLQEKSFLVLNELLKSPGRVVTREDLSAVLWPGEYVDAEHGLNTAVRRLREALGDSADEARFVETLPKLGYRFIGAIEEVRYEQLPPPASIAPPVPVRPFRRAFPVAAAILVAVALALVLAFVARSRSTRAEAETAAVGSTPAMADPVQELLARARYLRHHKRIAEANQFVEKALKLDPKNPETLAAHALGLMGKGMYEQARETARRAIELDPNAWEAHRALGNMAYRMGDFVGAERHYRRSVDANPKDYKTRNRFARHLLECGRIAEAKEQMLEARRLAPDDPDVQNIWIQFAVLTGDYESAIRQGEIWMAVWEKQLPPGSVSLVRDMLGLAYVGARRHEEAIAQFRAIDPDDDLRVAVALGYAGRIGEAREILERHEATDAAAGSAADPELAGAMAMAYIVIGDFDRAFEHLDRQLAGREHPGWLHYPLFQSIRRDARWPALAERLEREFFSGEEREPPAGGGYIHPKLPRAAKAAAAPPAP